MARDPEDARETTWQITVRWFENQALAAGASPERARDIAQRNAISLLREYGRGMRYVQGVENLQRPALESRDEAIRAAHRRGSSAVVILRTFRISRGHLYRILNGKRSGWSPKEEGGAREVA